MKKTFGDITINVEQLLFVILVMVFCITASNEVGSSLSIYKYIILVICIIESFFKYKKQKKKFNKIYAFKEIKSLIFCVIVIFLFSFIRSIIESKFSFRTVQEILFLVSPMIYAYFLINCLSQKQINSIMKVSLLIVLFFYIFSLNLNAKEIINALLNSSFSESSSALESHIYSGFALSFCIYFCYFSNEKIYKYLSLLFVIMTFKRFSIIVAFILYFLSNSKAKKIAVSKKVYVITGIILLGFSILYYNLMLPENVIMIENNYNLDVSKLTSTRSDRLHDLIYSSYESYGFGSSTEYMYNHFYGALEMDIVKIIIELGYIPVIILIFVYLYVGKTNLYAFSVMCCQVISLVFSSNLTSSFAWILIFVTLFLISKYKDVERSKNEIS